MNINSFGVVARHVAMRMSRRGSFRLLGGAALATAFAAPALVRAGKAGKKAKKVCKRQRNPCEAGVRAFCGEQSLCLENILPCCQTLATCQTTAAIECLATFGGSISGPEQAALAAPVNAPGVAAAGKSTNAKKRCKQQRGQCLAFLTDFCDGNVNCEARSPLPCCEHFAECDVAAATECILRALD